MTTQETGALTLEGMSSDLFREEFYEEMKFEGYLELAYASPEVAYSAWQRLYHAVIAYGAEKYRFAHFDRIKHPFFDDLFGDSADAVFGLDPQLTRLVEIWRAAAARLGQEKRLILLNGPVGSSKSTIARIIRRGLEAYSRTDEGKLFTFAWLAHDQEEKDILGLVGRTGLDEKLCPIHEEPLMLLPRDARQDVVKDLNAVQVNGRDRLPQEAIELEGDLCPYCR